MCSAEKTASSRPQGGNDLGSEGKKKVVSVGAASWGKGPHMMCSEVGKNYGMKWLEWIWIFFCVQWKAFGELDLVTWFNLHIEKNQSGGSMGNGLQGSKQRRGGAQAPTLVSCSFRRTLDLYGSQALHLSKEKKWISWKGYPASHFAISWFNIIAQEKAIVPSWAGKQ